MSTQKSLGLPHRFEFPHSSLPYPGWLMGLLNAIIRILGSVVDYLGDHLPIRGRYHCRPQKISTPPDALDEPDGNFRGPRRVVRSVGISVACYPRAFLNHTDRMAHSFRVAASVPAECLPRRQFRHGIDPPVSLLPCNFRN
jgi:hypothetical protein